MGEAEVAPGGLAAGLGGAGDAEGGVLVGHDVVLVLGVDGLVVRRHVHLVGRQPVVREVVEEVRVPSALQVYLREVTVFVLSTNNKNKKEEGVSRLYRFVF